MKPVREIVSREIIDDLWGAGYTILPRFRHSDPFHVPPELVPRETSYQWMPLKADNLDVPHDGWKPVPASRHDGYFAPAGYMDNIEVQGMGLFEKPRFEVEASKEAQIAAAKKMVTDWADRNSALFEGSVTIGGQTKLGEMDTIETIKIGATKTIENTTEIPRDLVPYIAEIFEERDRLSNVFVYNSSDRSEVFDIERNYMSALSENPSAPKWPTLNGIILPFAIENVRKRITEEATNGQAS